MSIHLKLRNDKGQEIFVADFESLQAIDLEGLSLHPDTTPRIVQSLGQALLDLERASLPPTDEEKAARAYQNVMGVINPGACNLSGVARSFGEDVIAIRRAEGLDTPGTNKHPLVLLYLHQLAFLATGYELLTQEQYDNALAWVKSKCSRQ